MKKILTLLICLIFQNSLCGQTIIDLKPGGGVRAKTAEEYRAAEPGLAEKLKADSIQYNDNVTRALNFLYRDSLDHAEQLMTEALKLRPQAPSNFILRHYLGKIEMARGNFRKAIAAFTPLLKDRPENREVRFDRATCFLEIKNAKAALEDCNIILRHELGSDEMIKTLFLSSACHTANRHPDEAKKDLEKILKLDPVNESAQLLLAMTFQHLGQHAEALNRLNLFVSSHPNSTDGLVARAELEEQLKMYEAARADYDKAIEICNDVPSLYLKRAQLLRRLNRHQLAEKDRQKALQLGYPAEHLK